MSTDNNAISLNANNFLDNSAPGLIINYYRNSFTQSEITAILNFSIIGGGLILSSNDEEIDLGVLTKAAQSLRHPNIVMVFNLINKLLFLSTHQWRSDEVCISINRDTKTIVVNDIEMTLETFIEEY